MVRDERLFKGGILRQGRKGHVRLEDLRTDAAGDRFGDKGDGRLRQGGVPPGSQGMEKGQVAAQFARLRTGLQGAACVDEGLGGDRLSRASPLKVHDNQVVMGRLQGLVGLYALRKHDSASSS